MSLALNKPKLDNLAGDIWKIVVSLARQLEREYGRGYAEKNLRRMVQFAGVFPDREIVVSLIRQLTWTHFLALIPLDKPLQRDFNAETCRGKRSLNRREPS